MSEIFIYSKEDNIKITGYRTSMLDYDLMCSISFQGDMRYIDKMTSIYIHNNINSISCGFYIKNKYLSLFDSHNKKEYLRLENEYMIPIFDDLYNKLAIIWKYIYNVNIENDNETANEIFNMLNIINRCINQFYNEYCLFVENINHYNPFKALPKSAN